MPTAKDLKKVEQERACKLLELTIMKRTIREIAREAFDYGISFEEIDMHPDAEVFTAALHIAKEVKWQARMIYSSSKKHRK